jgi:hypothetical protein
MEIREYRLADLDRIKAIHKKQGFQFDFPDLTDPTFAVGCVAAKNDEAQMATFLRVTAEAYLFVDPQAGTPRERWQALLQVHEQVRQQAASLGLSQVQAFLPPELGKRFDRRLKKLGWQQETWRSYGFRLR